MDLLTTQNFLSRKRLRKRKNTGEVDHSHTFFKDNYDEQTQTYQYNYADELEYIDKFSKSKPQVRLSEMTCQISEKGIVSYVDFEGRKKLRKRKDNGHVDHSHSFFIDGSSHLAKTINFNYAEEAEYIKMMTEESSNATESLDQINCPCDKVEEETQLKQLKVILHDCIDQTEDNSNSDDCCEDIVEEENKETRDTENSELMSKFPIGNVVWGKFGKTHWWPAIVIHGKQAKQRTKPNYVWLYWLSDRKLSQVKEDNVVVFQKQILRHLMKKPMRPEMQTGIQRALSIFIERQQEKLKINDEDSSLKDQQEITGEKQAFNDDKQDKNEMYAVNAEAQIHMNDDEKTGTQTMIEVKKQTIDKTFSDGVDQETTIKPVGEVTQTNNCAETTVCMSVESLRKNEQLKADIADMMADPVKLLQLIENNSEILNPRKESTIPNFVLNDLKKYDGLDTDSDDNEDSHESLPISFCSYNRQKSRLKSYGEFDSNNTCLACLMPCSAANQHPLFEGLLCDRCKIAMKKHMFATDVDNCSLVCAICADLGLLVLCGDKQCGKCYCIECVNNFTSKDISEKIEKDPDWICFLCKDYSEASHGKIVPRKNWDHAVIQFYNDIIVCNDLSYLTDPGKRKIRVLSLFDGIGTGKVVLDELGFDIDVYYFSEICLDALDVTRHNHKDLVKQIENPNATKSLPLHECSLSQEKSILSRGITLNLADLCPIDLILAGPPCNDLSIVNPKRRGFEGTGILVLKFQMILREIETLCRGATHVFWMMENTGSMVSEYKQDIADSFGMEPAVWDAKYFSGQRRSRNFWGNIPGLYSTPDVLYQLEKEKTTLDDVLTQGHNCKAVVQHTRTITSSSNSLTITNGKNDKLVTMDGVEDGLWTEEIERLFGFPTGYTDTGSLPETRRKRLLGKAWSVPVVKQILSPLKKYFKLRDT